LTIRTSGAQQFPPKIEKFTTERTESTEAAKRGINTKAFSPFFSVSSVLSVVKNFERELLSGAQELPLKNLFEG
jgi:hypothetical protein